MMARAISKFLGWIVVGLVLLFLVAPIFVVIISSFSPRGYLTFPPTGVSFRWYQEIFSSGAWLLPFAISIILAVVVGLVTTALGFCASYAIVRRGFRGSGAYSLLLISPLLFPHAAIGVALLGIMFETGAMGTYHGIFVAHLILCLPFAFRPLLNAMRKMDASLEEAAMILGASPREVFFRVTLPVLKPGIVTALTFSMIMSFDEVTVTIFLIGPDVVTLPTRIFTYIQESGSPVVAAVATVLILITVGIVLLLRKAIGLTSVLDSERT